MADQGETLLRIFCTIQICRTSLVDVAVLMRKAQESQVKFDQVRNLLLAKATRRGSLAEYNFMPRKHTTERMNPHTAERDYIDNAKLGSANFLSANYDQYHIRSLTAEYQPSISPNQTRNRAPESAFPTSRPRPSARACPVQRHCLL
jgi:hypothetical protein